MEQRSFATVILVTGMDGAGKSEVIHKLLEWLDPRHVRVAAYGEPDDTERTRPPDVALLARPAAARRDLGRVRLLVQRPACATGWPAMPARPASSASSPRSTASRRCSPARACCCSSSSWCCLGQGAEAAAGRLGQADRRRQPGARGMGRQSSSASRRRPLVEEMVRRTSTGHAPWIVLPCDDPEYRDLAFGRAGPERPAGAAGEPTAANAGSRRRRPSPTSTAATCSTPSTWA